MRTRSGPTASLTLVIWVIGFVNLAFANTWARYPLVAACVCGLIAVVLGLLTLSQIRKSGGQPTGHLKAYLAVSFVVLVLAALCLPLFTSTAKIARMTHCAINARYVCIALKAYAADHRGQYPDAAMTAPQNSNEVFRELFKGGYVMDERIFTCPASPFTNDEVIGEAPEYAEALTAGENHWAMTKGLSDSSSGNVPLLFENPVDDSWPPVWNCDAAGQPKPGRAWKGGKIIMALNDGSCPPFKLSASSGSRVGLAKTGDAAGDFDQISPPWHFLNVLP